MATENRDAKGYWEMRLDMDEATLPGSKVNKTSDLNGSGWS